MHTLASDAAQLVGTESPSTAGAMQFPEALLGGPLLDADRFAQLTRLVSETAGAAPLLATILTAPKSSHSTAGMAALTKAQSFMAEAGAGAASSSLVSAGVPTAGTATDT